MTVTFKLSIFQRESRIWRASISTAILVASTKTKEGCFIFYLDFLEPATWPTWIFTHITSVPIGAPYFCSASRVDISIHRILHAKNYICLFDICHIATFPYSHRSPHFTQMLRMHLYYLLVLLVYLQKSIKLSLIYWLLISECITFFSFRDFTLEITWFTSAVTRPFTSAASLMTRLHLSPSPLPSPPPLPLPLPSSPSLRNKQKFLSTSFPGLFSSHFHECSTY